MPVVTLADQSVICYVQNKITDSLFPPLVLIHGAGGSHLDWPPELRRLPGARIFALDLPGHGRAAGPGRTTIAAYAEDVCALLDTLNIEQAIFVGHSMGGAITQHIGANKPDRAAGLILLGTGSKLPVEPTLPRRLIEDTAPTIDWLMEWSWSEHAAPGLKALGRQRLLAPTGVLSGDYLACQQFDGRESLAQITAPTLVIGATGDRMVPLKFSQTLGERITNATLIVIKAAGHMFPLEKPQQVSGHIAEWLAEQTW